MGEYKMKILCKSQPQTLSANQQVNRIGRYLYNNIDGAFKYKKSSNTFDVYFTLLYQLPLHMQDESKGQEYNDVHEITVDINITTYQNKVRVNTIELTPMQRTLGYDLYEPSILEDLESAKRKIFNKVCKKIYKAYSEYEFLF